MKKLILPLFAFISSATQAQFSIVPLIGFESAKTNIQSGDYASFSPLGNQISPSLSVRMAYTLKSGQGAFLGIATSSPAVELKFTDPDNAQKLYTAATKNLQLRFEGGYQFTSKPITLKKSTNISPSAGRYVTSNTQKSGCTRSICGGMRSSASRFANTAVKTNVADKGLYLRIKPSVGVAVAPSGSEMAIETAGNQSTYLYRTGWNTSVIAGTAFEFGSQNQSRFIVAINYFRSLGNNSHSVTNSDAFKPTVTNFSSNTSGFNVSLGIPFSLKKKAAVVATPPVNRTSYRGHCTRYKLYQ